jgi:hypothetical protein
MADVPKQGTTEGCENFAGSDGQCNACRRGEKPDSGKRRREEEAAKAAEERAREKKKQKKDEYRERHAPCSKCGGKEMLTLVSRGNDNNYWTLPSGEEGEGYMPSFPGLSESDGVEMTLCVDCGTVVGFDSEALKAAIAEQEANREE